MDIEVKASHRTGHSGVKVIDAFTVSTRFPYVLFYTYLGLFSSAHEQEKYKDGLGDYCVRGGAPGRAPGPGKIIMLVLIGLLVLICLGVLLLLYFQKQKQSFGVLKGNRMYQDTQEKPGVLLRAKTIPLVGKPDYLLRDKDGIFPVEVKTGKTPQYPYINHTMQLMAYCFLVEEHFGVKVVGGYVRYPGEEFKLAYTEEARQSVIEVVHEIMDVKINNREFVCTHVEHQIGQ